MAKVTAAKKAAAEAQLKATAVLEANEAASHAEASKHKTL
jgi:hypothetical protein